VILRYHQLTNNLSKEDYYLKHLLNFSATINENYEITYQTVLIHQLII